MHARIRGLLAVVVFASALVSPKPAHAQILGVLFDTSAIYNVSPADGSLTFVANTGLSLLGALEYAPDGTLYGFTAGGSASLYSFNTTTYAPTLIGAFGQFSFEGGLAFSPQGVAYGVNRNNSAFPELFTINLATGATTLVGTISGGEHDINGLAWRSDGQLIGIDRVSNSLLTINPNTAASAVLAPIGAVVANLGGMTVLNGVGYFGTSGTSGGGSNELYSFDLFTGAQTLVGMYGPISTGSGIAALAAPIPEPSSLILLGVAGAAVRYRKRRK